jgi:hypothetical protein
LANIINGTDTGSGGLITTGDSSDELQLQTAEVARVTLTNTAVVVNESGADVDFRVEGDTDANLLFVDASADSIGIGTSSPSAALHIAGTSSLSSEFKVGDLTWNSSSGGGALVQYRGSDDYTELQINNPVAGTNALTIRDGTDGTVVLLQDGGGKFKKCVGVGAATPAASGAGITFPATQNASSDANTLDDYEEGTWTPSDQSGAGLTLTNAEGKYTKIGRQVTAWGWVLYPSTANGTNNQIGGLPFSIANSNPNRGGGMIGFKTDATVVTLRGENSGTFFQFKDSTGGNITNATLSTDQFFFAITYEVA